MGVNVFGAGQVQFEGSRIFLDHVLLTSNAYDDKVALVGNVGGLDTVDERNDLGGFHCSFFANTPATSGVSVFPNFRPQAHTSRN